MATEKAKSFRLRSAGSCTAFVAVSTLLAVQSASAQPRKRILLNPFDVAPKVETLRGPRLRVVGHAGFGMSATAGGTIEAAGHYHTRRTSAAGTWVSDTWVNAFGDLSSARLTLETSGGGGLELSFPIHRNFLLGGLLSFSAWDFTAPEGKDHDASLFVDIAALPTLRGAFVNGSLEFYASMPIGAVVSVLDGDALMDAVAAAYADLRYQIRAGDAAGSMSVGFFIRWVLGLQYFFSRGVGAFAEISYCYRTVGHAYDFNYETGKSFLSFTGDLTLGYQQFVLAFGLAFAWGVQETEILGFSD